MTYLAQIDNCIVDQLSQSAPLYDFLSEILTNQKTAFILTIGIKASNIPGGDQQVQACSDKYVLVPGMGFSLSMCKNKMLASVPL